MYKCENCGTISKKGEKAFKKIIETRAVSYNNGKHQGTEIVKEQTVCSKCI